MRALTTFHERLLDLFFPRTCVICGSEGSWACAECQLAVADIESRSRELEGGIRAISLLPFEVPLVRELLHYLKYNGIREAAGSLMELVNFEELSDALGRLVDGGAVLVPVPTSKATLKRRGYNQAEELARAIGQRLGLAVRADVLVRVRKQGSQVGKSADERAFEMATSFALNERLVTNEIWKRPLLLFDDVMTTGSTVAACARLIAERASRPVTILTLAYVGSEHKKEGR